MYYYIILFWLIYGAPGRKFDELVQRFCIMHSPIGNIAMAVAVAVLYGGLYVSMWRRRREYYIYIDRLKFH